MQTNLFELLYTMRRMWDLTTRGIGPGALSDRIVMPAPRRRLVSSAP